MTNLLGAALIILNVNITTNFYTNLFFHSSCEEAGCTNGVWRDSVTWNGDSATTNRVKACGYMHVKETVMPFNIVETITLGADVRSERTVCLSNELAIWYSKDHLLCTHTHIPLFRLITVTPHADNIYPTKPATFIERLKRDQNENQRITTLEGGKDAAGI